MPFLPTFAAALWALMLDTGVWLIAGLALAGVVHALVPPGFLTKHLGGTGARPIIKAALLGIPLPLCSCSVIPVAAGLRRSGAGKGATAAFAISTPQTGEESIPLTWALFGPAFAIARPVVAVITACLAGVLIDRFASATDRPAAPADRPLTVGRTISLGVVQPPRPPAAPPPLGFMGRVRKALRHGFVTMPIDLAPWLAIGLTLAALLSAIVPENWIAQPVGSGPVPMLAMLLVGLPLYVCATSSTPLAASLVAAGLSPGAALVLLMAGPATNLATMTWVLKDLGARALLIYLVVIATVAVAAGLAFDALFVAGAARSTPAEAHQHHASLVATVSAVALVALIVVALFARVRRDLARASAARD